MKSTITKFLNSFTATGGKMLMISLTMVLMLTGMMSYGQSLTGDVLVVSGGGSGGAGYGGGGGGGAVKYFTSQTITGSVSVTIGIGGAAVALTGIGPTVGNPGNSSSFGSLVATSSSSANGPNSSGGGGGGGGSGGGAGGNIGAGLVSGGTDRKSVV